MPEKPDVRIVVEIVLLALFMVGRVSSLTRRGPGVETGTEEMRPGGKSGNPSVKMHWSKKGYALGVVVRGGHHLRSWPTYANIPFADPSAIPGGQPTIRFLLALWDVGILRFEPATADEIDLARRNPDAVLPGAPPALPAPFCWGPFGRNDIGLGRLRPKTNPLGRPLRHPKNGPKTPKLLLDSDGEDDEIVETEGGI